MADAQQPIALSYNGTLHRVRVAMKRSVTRSNPEPPRDLFQRAKDKLDAEKKKGQISEYVIYSRQFTALWQRLASNELPHVSGDAEIQFTLGAGTPVLKGLEISATIDDDAVCDISIHATPEDIKQWRFTWFQVAVEAWLVRAGKPASVDRAQLRSMMARTLRKQPVLEESLHAAPSMALQKQFPGKPFTVMARADKREHVFVIFDVDKLSRPGELDTLMAKLKAYGQKLETDTKAKFRFYDTEVRADIEQCIGGAERFGIGVPAVMLAFFRDGEAAAASAGTVATKPVATPTAPSALPAAAAPVAKTPNATQTAVAPAVAKSAAPAATAVESVPLTYPGRGLLELEISGDRMQAQIKRFKMGYYDRKIFNPDEGWLRLELRRLRVNGASEKLIVRAAQTFQRLRDPNQLIVAMGELGQPGRGPKFELAPAAPVPTPGAGGDGKDGKTDMRVMQIALVKPGEVIGQVVYEHAGTMGKDVMGNPIAPPPGPAPNITLGDGAELKDDGKYYAKRTGLISFIEDTLDVSLTYVHAGDVNLTSGDIRFSGKVIIEGSIDHGACVITSGDIEVKKDVRGAKIVCGGNMKVAGGIITSEKGSVRVKGDIRAGFIENSTIWTDGDITVAKALLNSRVNCNGNLNVVGESARLSGGEVSVRRTIRAGNIGFAAGAPTRIILGRDWRQHQRVRIRKSRLDRLDGLLESEKKELRELVRRRKDQMTARYDEMKDRLMKRIEHLKRIVAKLSELVGKFTREASFNGESCVYATESLYPSVAFEIGDVTVSPPQAVGGMGVTATKIDTSHIVTIAELEKQIRARTRVTPPQIDKKAS